MAKFLGPSGVVLPGNPSAGLQASTKQYVDARGPVDCETVHYNAEGNVNNIWTTGSFVDYSHHPWLLCRVPQSGRISVTIGARSLASWNTAGSSIALSPQVERWNSGGNEWHGYTPTNYSSDSSPGSRGSVISPANLDRSAYTVSTTAHSVIFSYVYSGLTPGTFVRIGSLGRISSGTSTTYEIWFPYVIAAPSPPYLMSAG